MKTFRKERLSNLILEELSKLIARELEFDEILVTLTYADISVKMETVQVGVSVIPSDKSEAALKILQKARPELQYLLVKKLSIRHVPEIKFENDSGYEDAAGIEKSLMKDKNILDEE